MTLTGNWKQETKNLQETNNFLQETDGVDKENQENAGNFYKLYILWRNLSK